MYPWGALPHWPMLGQRGWEGWVARRSDRGWGNKAVVAAAKHDGGDSRHDRLGLYIQVAVNSSDRHCPIRRMRSESMPPQSMAIAAPARVERAEMS